MGLQSMEEGALLLLALQTKKGVQWINTTPIILPKLSPQGLEPF